MVVFTLLGFVAGVKTMIRSAEEVAAQADRSGRGRETTRRGNVVATESTNADGKSGSGRMVFFVLIAIAVVLFILGLTDSYTQDGPNIHPMDQFIVEPLFGDGPVHWYTPTNVTLWMALSVASVAALMVMGTGGRAVIPSRSAIDGGTGLRLCAQDGRGRGGQGRAAVLPLHLHAVPVHPFREFPRADPDGLHHHVAYRGDGDPGGGGLHHRDGLVGFIKNGAGFLSLFWVSSAPLALRPILAIIEVISYFVRPVSHSIRLGGNMMAGHAVLKVFAGFAGALGLAGIAPILGVVAIYGLEVLVSAIQAYVFTILTCVYLKDALHPHHCTVGRLPTLRHLELPT
jgi:F-type H+-transporting ATPase subunit a